MAIKSKEDLLLTIKKFSKSTKASEIIEMLERQGLEFEDNPQPTPSFKLSMPDVGQSLAEIKEVAYNEEVSWQKIVKIKKILSQC